MKLPAKLTHSGIGANHGTRAKPLNLGLAAQNGVSAAATHEMVHATAKTVVATPEIVNASPEMPGATLQPPD